MSSTCTLPEASDAVIVTVSSAVTITPLAPVPAFIAVIDRFLAEEES